jgi:DNA-binding transcriptional regulator WhiA
MTNSVSGATTESAKKDAIKQSLNDLTNQITKASNDTTKLINNRNNQLKKLSNKLDSFSKIKVDHKALSLNFIQQIIIIFYKI